MRRPLLAAALLLAGLTLGERSWAEPVDDINRALDAVAFADRQARATAAWLQTTYPTTFANRSITVTQANESAWKTDDNDWTKGYWPGMLWRLFEITGQDYHRSLAALWSADVEDKSGDYGNFFAVFLPAWRNATDPAERDRLRNVLLAGADRKAGGASNSNFSELCKNFGYYRTSGLDAVERWHAFADHMPDLELVLWAANPVHHTNATRAADLLRMAKLHLATSGQVMIDPPVTFANGPRRAGSNQRAYFDATRNGTAQVGSGNFLQSERKQGWDHETSWSRGQSWLLYGFSTAAEQLAEFATAADQASLDQIIADAKRLVEFTLTHLPDRLSGARRVPGDLIPHFDYDYTAEEHGGPDGPYASLRDSSAGALAASGILHLVRVLPASDPDRARYLAEAGAMLMQLCSPPYLAEGSGSVAILRRGCYNYWDANANNVGTSWGDYYLIDALGVFLDLHLPPPLSYDTWAGSLPPGQDDPEDNPDNDANSNLVEFALGTDPLAPDQASPIATLEPGPDPATVRATLLRPSERRSVRVSASLSTDLLAWTPLAYSDLDIRYLGGGLDEISVTLDAATAPAGFVRFHFSK